MLRKLFLSLLLAAGCLPLSAARPGFTLWQLPPQGPSQMNSYVIRTDAGRVAVIDGGTAADAPTCGDSSRRWATAWSGGS